MIQDFKSLLSSAVEIRARLSVPPLRWVPGIGEEHVLRVAVAFLVCLGRWREREIRREGGREGGRGRKKEESQMCVTTKFKNAITSFLCIHTEMVFGNKMFTGRFHL